VNADVIPAQAWAKSLHIIFGMIATRRGPHWKLSVLPAESNPFGNGALDEGEMLGEAIANVMKYVPLPGKELGIVNDVGTLVFAFYAAINARVQGDKQLAAMFAAQQRGARVAGPASTPPRGEVTGHHEPVASNGEVTAADLLAAMPSEPLAAVTHEQTGDTYADGVQLGHAPTALLRNDEDPEPVLMEAFRPGEKAVPIDVLAASGDGDVLDRLAPPIEVEGAPALRDLGDAQPTA
jgi:hypothetical protein